MITIFEAAWSVFVIQILGVASAYPDTAVTDELLSSPGAETKRGISAGITNRWSVLPADYIRATGNSDKLEGNKAATLTPTELGLRAARAALERAGIESESIGLILADSTNPLETTPAEAQRVCGKLGLKIEAFDVVLTDAGLPGYLTTLKSWKKERFPDYVLCVSMSTPTRALDFRSGEARYFLGDVAAAIVISRAKPGRFSVHAAKFERFKGDTLILGLGLYGELRLEMPSNLDAILDGAERLALEGLGSHRLAPERLKLIAPPLGRVFAQRLADRLRIQSSNVLQNQDSVGCTLGVAGWSALADHWESVEKGDFVLCLSCGVGTHQGFALLEHI